jgi:hypothetical protein
MSSHRIEQLKKGDSLVLDEVQTTRAEVKRHVDRLTDEIRLLETNLDFFSSSNSKNSLLDDARSKLDRKNKEKEQWKLKLKELNIIKHRIERENEQTSQAEESNSENLNTAN